VFCSCAYSEVDAGESSHSEVEVDLRRISTIRVCGSHGMRGERCVYCVSSKKARAVLLHTHTKKEKIFDSDQKTMDGWMDGNRDLMDGWK